MNWIQNPLDWRGGPTALKKMGFRIGGEYLDQLNNYYSNKNTQLDTTINRKILLLCRTDTAQRVSDIIMPTTTVENTSTSTFIRKSEAATAV